MLVCAEEEEEQKGFLDERTYIQKERASGRERKRIYRDAAFHFFPHTLQ